MAKTLSVQVTRIGGFEAFARGLPAAAERAVALASHRVEAVSVTRVPFDNHDLQNSRRVEVTGSSDGAEGTVGYYIDYARYQHENALIHLNGREDHYLSSAITDERANAYKIMALEIRKLMS